MGLLRLCSSPHTPGLTDPTLTAATAVDTICSGLQVFMRPNAQASQASIPPCAPPPPPHRASVTLDADTRMYRAVQGCARPPPHLQRNAPSQHHKKPQIMQTHVKRTCRDCDCDWIAIAAAIITTITDNLNTAITVNITIDVATAIATPVTHPPALTTTSRAPCRRLSQLLPLLLRLLLLLLLLLLYLSPFILLSRHLAQHQARHAVACHSYCDCDCGCGCGCDSSS